MKRDRAAERSRIRRQLGYVISVLQAALMADEVESLSTPVTRRVQSLKIKVATRELVRLDTAIRLGKGRG